MTAVTIIDQFANISTRRWSSIALLPPVELGSILIVDDGTNGGVYAGLNLGGTPSWVLLSNAPSVGGFVKTSPASVLDNVISASPGSGIPVINVSSALLPTQSPINPYGEPTAASFTVAELVAANSGQLGGIVRLIEPAGADQLWVCLNDDTGSPVFRVVYPPPIQLPQTLVRTSPDNLSTLQQSLDAGVSWSDRFIVPNPPNSITNPIPIPLLPTATGQPIDFWLFVVATGQYLPYLIPTGYTVQVIETRGLWGATHADAPDFIGSPGGGSDGAGGPFTAHDPRFPLEQAISQFFDSSGSLYAFDGTNNFDTLFLGKTMARDSYISLLENIVSAGSFSGVTAGAYCRIVITPPTPTAVQSVANFEVSNYGFHDFQRYTPNDSLWVSGSGWQSNSGAHLVDIYRRVLSVGSITRVRFTVRQINGFVQQTEIRMGSNLGAVNKGLWVMPFVFDSSTGLYVSDSDNSSTSKVVGIPNIPFVTGDFFEVLAGVNSPAPIPQLAIEKFEYWYEGAADPFQ